MRIFGTKLLLVGMMLLIALSTLGMMARPVKGSNPNILYINPNHINNGQAVGANINFAVKVFQIDPFNAWIIQVAVDPTVLNPTSFTITPNTLTANYSIGELELTHCINGSGSGCNTAGGDGPGVVTSLVFPMRSAPSVPSISGLILNITYAVVKSTGATTVHLQNTQIVSSGVVIITTNQDGSYGTPPRDNTSTVVVCSPSSILAGQASTCTATVTDTTTASNTPTGTVSFTATGVVTPSSTSCTLASGSCVVTFTGTASGTAMVTGTYGGDLTHNPSAPSAGATITVGPNTTATSVTCNSPVTVGQSSTCTARVTGGSTTPSGSVTFTSDAALLPSSVSCVLSASGSCSVIINTPPGSGGTHNVVASYGGDASHTTSSGTTSLVVNDFTITASPAAFIVPVGASNSTTITLTSLGAFTGSIALSISTLPSGVIAGFVPNPVALATGGGTGTSQLTVSVTATVSDFSFTVTGTGGGLSHSTSPISVHVVSAPVFSSGKLHWTHRLSLSMSGSTQTWTASVSNPTLNSVSVLVHIVGTSQTNPALGFDITCGTSCVNTGSAVAPVNIAAGSSLTFSFSQSIPSNFVSNKFSFTATLLWGPAGSTPSTTSSSKSGAFDVSA